MATNGISELATKELRQIAKLDLAATKRAADGNARATYDLTQLPTLYDDNIIVDNANTGGLIVGRPWIDVGQADAFILLENGDNLIAENNDNLITE